MPNPKPPLVCPSCGLSAALLHDTGRMGCARCYETFADMVAEAVRELHGGNAPPLPSLEPKDAHPWPTRRARPRRDESA